jgi:hypothetical protein
VPAVRETVPLVVKAPERVSERARTSVPEFEAIPGIKFVPEEEITPVAPTKMIALLVATGPGSDNVPVLAL